MKFSDTITSIMIDYENHKVFVTGRCKARDIQKENGGKENE
jgi:hypothetical protein